MKLHFTFVLMRHKTTQTSRKTLRTTVDFHQIAAVLSSVIFIAKSVSILTRISNMQADE